ncbi:MAG TPA: hypothetical protein VNU92_05180 [Edaphobacter sp.]|jgi:hypothetical protein|nr:hypothetical protein [Edaphobacter sp.]
MKLSFLLLLPMLITLPLGGQAKSNWRAATTEELATLLPARAPVQKERIETEMRTASGIINSHGKFIAGVVLITAGYSADGKYSHYLIVQSPLTIADIALSPGSYVFGWQRTENTLLVKFYEATTGAERGTATAHRMSQGTRVESFRLWPPGDQSILQIGRFGLPYHLSE